MLLLQRTFRSILEVSYDFLKILPNSPLKLPSILLQSLLSMLIEHIGCSREAGSSTKVLPPIYNHLQSFLQLSFYSPSRYVREKAYILAKAAMMSTGAFDNNPCEIASWFLFIPGDVAQYDGNKCQEDKLLQTLSSSVVSFLCDTVSTVGNNLVKHWEITKCKYFNVKTIQGITNLKSSSITKFFLWFLIPCIAWWYLLWFRVMTNLDWKYCLWICIGYWLYSR